MISRFLKKKNRHSILVLVALLLCVETINAQGSDNMVESDDVNILESEEVSNELEQSIETDESQILSESEESLNEKDESVISYAIFEQILPFVQYLSYTYNHLGANQDVIMEFYPDATGTFQVVVLSGNQAQAYVYQIKSSGLYELAVFDDYDEVKDLRQTIEATSGSESLIIPRNLTVGTQFLSGYNNEKTCEVEEIMASYMVGDTQYNDVVKIKSEGPNGTEYQYYASSYGLIKVEQGDNTITTLLHVDTPTNQ